MLHSATTASLDYAQKTEMKEERESTQYVNVENRDVGKTTAAHRLQKITM